MPKARKQTQQRKNEGAAPAVPVDEEASVGRAIPASDEIPAPGPVITCLDDAASFLVQLEPSNTAELARVCDGLKALMNTDAAPPNTGAVLSEAVQLISEVVQSQPSDAEDLLGVAGRLIDKAMRLRDTLPPLPANPPLPAPKAAVGFPEVPEFGHFGEGAESHLMSHNPVCEEASVKKSAPPASTVPPKKDLILFPANGDPELINEFITESCEYLEKAEAALLMLEADPEDMEAVNTIFRAFHTIKGTSGFLGVTAMGELAHLAESLLSRVRDREIRCSGGYADLALQSADTLKKLLQLLQEAMGGTVGDLPPDYEDLLQILRNPEAAGTSSEADAIDIRAPRVGDILVATGKAERQVVEAAVADKGDSPVGVALVRSQAASAKDVAEAMRIQQRIASTNQDRGEQPSMRVRTDRLDRLIDMIGELVIAQSMISQDETVISVRNHEFLKKVTHTGKIVRELHDLSLSMRMLPLKATFQKMARLVRDLGHKSGKPVIFETDGEDTEIDRNMVDVIADPLIHMVRNAVDHGIEPPDAREAAGKPREGKVRLAAYHSGGNVVVELRDDGKGLDREKIISKAVAKGLIESDQGMSDKDVFNLIFVPGFSTADKVTDVSGRGVGMDVVRRNVEALRGRIEIASKPGQGSIFTVRLPLTLAITDGMLVRVGTERYIVPTVSIHLSFRPQPDSLSTVTGKGELVLLRGKLLPVFRLHRLFGVRSAIEDATRGLLVVVGSEDCRCALLVDELLGQQQVVAKSLGNGIGKIQGIAGGAILADGRVGLILDTAELINLARTVGPLEGMNSKNAA
jgi:two-component system chemotaxis sensor kinase CheA